MKKISMYEATAPATGLCFLCSKNEAAKIFAQAGHNGATELCGLVEQSGQKHLLWVNIEENDLNFLPLFMDDMNLKSFHGVNVYPLRNDAMLYLKVDQDIGVCFMFLSEQGLVRQLKMYSDETLVEDYCKLKGIKPEHIALCKICTIPDNKCISVCWSVSYENPNELDENGDPQECELLIPVDLMDSAILEEHGMNSLNNEYIHQGETFKLNGELFRALRDENNKLFITKDLFSPIKKENNQKQKSACQIIALKPN